MKLDKRDVTVVDPEFRMLNNRVGLFNSTMQDYKRYGIPKAQLILTDIPYSLGANAYGSNPSWYIDGDTTRTVKAIWQAKHSLLRTKISSLRK